MQKVSIAAAKPSKNLATNLNLRSDKVVQKDADGSMASVATRRVIEVTDISREEQLKFDRPFHGERSVH